MPIARQKGNETLALHGAIVRAQLPLAAPALISLLELDHMNQTHVGGILSRVCAQADEKFNRDWNGWFADIQACFSLMLVYVRFFFVPSCTGRAGTCHWSVCPSAIGRHTALFFRKSRSGRLSRVRLDHQMSSFLFCFCASEANLLSALPPSRCWLVTWVAPLD